MQTLGDIQEVETKSSNAAFWKGFQPAMFALLDFIQYVAGPYVATLLICEDQKVSEAEAEVIRHESAAFG
jgi:hypothetical protein